MIATTKVLRVPANAHGRDFVVGDVHGQLNMLDHLLAAVCFDSARDRLLELAPRVCTTGLNL